MAVVLLGALAPFVLLKLARFLEEETAVPPTDRPEREVPSDAEGGGR